MAEPQEYKTAYVIAVTAEPLRRMLNIHRPHLGPIYQIV